MNFLTGGNDLGTLGLGLLIAGAVAGLFSGVLGRGAGLILVSALFLAARGAGLAPDTAIHLSIGTSFACLVPLSLNTLAGRKYDRAKTARIRIMMLAGTGAGAALTLALRPGTLLVAAFAAVAVVAAGLTAGIWEEPNRARAWGRPAAAIAAAAATLVGTTGTALTVPLLMLSGLKHKQAASLAAEIAVCVAVVGAVVALIAGWDVHGLPRHSYGYVNLLAFGIVTPAAFATNLIGAHYADLIDAKQLRWLFAAFVLFSAARMVWSVIG